jgi:hypothetical protein
VPIESKSRQLEQADLLRPRLIDMRRPLVRLEALVNWEFFDRE